MKRIEVVGQNPLNGSIEIPGAKNSALPLLAASVLFTQKVVLNNVPNLSDVHCAIKILNELGCETSFQEDEVSVNAKNVEKAHIPQELMQTMRSSLFFLAPMLVRKRFASIYMPGGCKLGLRPIDIHLNGLLALGASVNYGTNNEQTIDVSAKNGLKGTDFTLKFPSVGATETLIMAAVTARGKTILRGVAKEPEVVDLIRFLQSAGAKIVGAGSDVLYIEGVDMLFGTRHKVCPDRITATTVLCATAACGGHVLVLNCDNSHLLAVIPLLKQLGCDFVFTNSDSVYVTSQGPKLAIDNVYTDIYPAFPTDSAPLLIAACLRAEGISKCTDTIFENRFACAHGFNALGASVKISKNTIAVKGANQLVATHLHAPDLRGGAALVIGAMQAKGKSIIEGVEYINRGYEDIVKMFSSLGANMKWV